VPAGALEVTLYDQPQGEDKAAVGWAVRQEIRRSGLVPPARAWDFLSIALSVVTADFAELRSKSPDGWTRELELEIAVADPTFWTSQARALEEILRFLTTDRWKLAFHDSGFVPAKPSKTRHPSEDCVALLSGGLDSLIGAIDLAAEAKKPLVVSQTVRGDGAKQIGFAQRIGSGLTHLQLNHNVKTPDKQETSQRARSLVFIAFGIIAATSLRAYQLGKTIPFYVCENGFIAINPALTPGRLGSLSTRTAHPEYLRRLEAVLKAAGLMIEIRNPYAMMTKGEMLRNCADQGTLKAEAVSSTSCGRFQHYNYHHCGRCVPCQVRRAAFKAWGAIPDSTDYVFEPLGKRDRDHAEFDDVRSIAMALATVEVDGLDRWLGNAISSPLITASERPLLRAMLDRGLGELKALHRAAGVK
jgi:7-cyano-7-deazaguanine synthase in queuosine biosynthesis